VSFVEVVPLSSLHSFPCRLTFRKQIRKFTLQKTPSLRELALILEKKFPPKS